MERVPEEEIMADAEQSEAYARADFEEVNQGFVDRFLSAFPELRQGRILDLGCGPADIPARIVKAAPGLHVCAVDASAAMLEQGRRRFVRNLPGRGVSLVQARLPALPFRIASFDGIVSNSLLHHLPDPLPFWSEVRDLGHPGTCIMIMDLCRPESREHARQIVETYSGAEPEILKRDFYNSLLAAFTVDEVRAQLHPALSYLACRPASDRHWLVSGRLR